MKKKFLKFALAICLVLLCTFLLSACQGGETLLGLEVYLNGKSEKDNSWSGETIYYGEELPFELSDIKLVAIYSTGRKYLSTHVSPEIFFNNEKQGVLPTIYSIGEWKLVYIYQNKMASFSFVVEQQAPPVCAQHVDENNDQKCDVCGVDMPTPPSCIEHTDVNGDGKCDVCGETVEAPIPPCEEHTDVNGDGKCDLCGESLPQPPCTQHVDENNDQKCDLCGADLPKTECQHIDSDNDQKCDLCGETVELPTPPICQQHDFTNGILQSGGTYHWYVCANCLEISTKQSHTYCDVSANCMLEEKCTLCNHVKTQGNASHDFANGSWIKDSGGHNKQCKYCTTTQTAQLQAHSVVAQTDCTQAVVCSDCNYVVTHAKTHSYGNLQGDASGHWQKCQNENCLVTTVKQPHATTTQTDCTQAVICSDCNYVVTHAKTHDFSVEYQGDGSNHWRVCNNANCLQTTSPTAHIDADDNWLCDVCQLTLSQKTGEYPLCLQDVKGVPISAIGGNVLTVASVATTDTRLGSPVLKQNIQSYRDNDGNNQEARYFRFTFELPWQMLDYVTIPITTNLINGGAFDIYVGGAKAVITTKDAWYYLTIKKDGSVYFGNQLGNQQRLTGAQIQGDIVIEIDNHRPTGTYYGALYIGYPTYQMSYDMGDVSNDYAILYEWGNDEIDYAACQLQKYYFEATGNDMLKSTYKDHLFVRGNKIVLGKLPAEEIGFGFDGLGESDCVIKKEDSVIYIYGKTGYAVINGVYALLENLFDLKIYYQDTYTITRQTDFELTADKVEEMTSNFTFDYILSGLGELVPTVNADKNLDYSYQMGFATDWFVNNGDVHNAVPLLEEYQASHPEWFYMPDGASYGQIYLAVDNFATGEGTLVTTVAEKIWQRIKDDTYNRSILRLFSPMDEDIWPTGAGYENADALKAKYGTNSAEYILFMNAVAKVIDEKLSQEPVGRHLQLALLCYNKTLVAPDLTGLSEQDKQAIMMYKGENISVVPLIAPVEGNRYLSFEDSRNKVKNPATGVVDNNSKTIAQVIQGWEVIANGNDMHLWWYASDGFDFFVMMDTITNMQNNYKFAKNHGITVFYTQSQGKNAVAPDWSRLKIYVQSALQKDVNANVDTLIEEFMNVYFGAGAEAMKQLLSAQKTWYANFFDAVFEENKGHYTAGGFCYSDNIEKWHFAETPKKPTLSIFDNTKDTMLVKWMGYIQSAKDAIDADASLTNEQKTVLKNRVEVESLTIRYTLVKIFGTTTYDASTDALYQFAKTLGVTLFKENGGAI